MSDDITPAKSTVKYDTEGASGPRTWTDRATDPEPLPNEVALAGHRRALRTHLPHRRYLTATRGLRRAQIAAYELGTTGREITMPVRGEWGEIVNLVRHPPGGRYYAAKGRDAALYPSLPPGPALLVAGMFDALIGRQNDLPTVTTTCGAKLPDYLLDRFAGRRVAVLYDTGEEREAQITVAKLWDVAVEVWRVEFTSFDGKDLSDWFQSGHTRDELLQIIREAR